MPVNINLLSDDVIARGITPPDIGNFGTALTATQDYLQKQREQGLFSGGLPRTPSGDVDWNKVGEQLARVQGAGAIPALAGLRTADIQQQALRDLPGATPLYSPNTTQPPRPNPAPVSLSRSTIQTAPSAADTADSGGVAASPGQNLVQPNEVPGSFKVTSDEPGQTLTARQIAQRTNQDPDLVASKLGVPVDQPMTPAEVRGKLQVIRPDAASVADRSAGEQPAPIEGLTPTKVATIPIRQQAPTEGATPAQVTIPARPQEQQAGAPPPPPAQQPIPQGQPGFFSEQNAQAYEDRARRVGYIAGRLALGGMAPAGTQYGQQAQRDFDVAKEIRGVLGNTATPTPEMKEAGATGQTLPEYQRSKADIPKDVEAFRKDFTAIQESGRNALVNITKAEAAKNLTLDPNYTSGPWSDQAKAFQQYRSLFGNRVGDIRAASPIEASEKLANDLVGEGIRSMGQAGVRVLRSEIPIIQKATANQGVTANTNRMLWEFAIRTYTKQAEIAQITQGLPANSAVLNKTVDQYLEAHPFLSTQERQNPNLLGSPNAPPGSTNWAPQQWRNWAAGAGLRSGDTVKVGPDTYGHIP